MWEVKQSPERTNSFKAWFSPPFFSSPTFHIYDCTATEIIRFFAWIPMAWMPDVSTILSPFSILEGLFFFLKMARGLGVPLEKFLART